MDDTLIDVQETKTKDTLAAAILLLLEDRRYFTQREYDIFIGCVCNGVTYESMGRKLGISRPRVSQILARTKDKIMSRMNYDNGIRRLVVKWLA
jgi:DNA-directed RNA polymerase sigma subunit (sigma70/sigma32)